jgi:TolA-binding protein
MNPRPNKRVARRQLQRTQDQINKRKRDKITSLEKQLKEAQARIEELEKVLEQSTETLRKGYNKLFIDEAEGASVIGVLLEQLKVMQEEER